ncbi:hypothetical protein [Saccharopolyspora mangrovi]|uniref:Uncharacterized protein n=1 Tax=Saccharopolyspora mangrovi TaxID=3082379 RepID=A0ABU6A797_9PSEU|nr:hypothetical protein [Saccharopolyspora sp. S2-29]MEB3367405.1 hypothetical protein [Saccharopolyspora sp. S2-29]
MPASTNLSLFEGNTDTITLAITKAVDSTAENLTSKVVEVYFKPSASTADTDPSVTKLVSPTDVTITDAAGGLAQFTVPAPVVASPGSTFWRCDVVSGANRRTSMYGSVTTENL